MPSEKSPAAQPIKDPRVPEAHQGIQVNFCKNPQCDNFHVPVKQGERGAGRGKKGEVDTRYTVVAVAKSTPAYKCKSCGEIFAAKSNKGISSELERITKYLSKADPSCSNPACPHHGLGIYSHPEAYSKFGKTGKGVPRYKCKADGCGKTLTPQSRRERNQSNTHLNIILFKLLMNKMPLGRILEITDIKKPTLYRRIDFFHEQCMRFIGGREISLLNGDIPLRRLYLSTDRQVYHSNWRSARVRRHVQFMGVGTADNVSGYVFPLTVNYDDQFDPSNINLDAIANGDLEKDHAFRRWGHYWLEDDYNESVKASKKKHKKKVDAKNESDKERRMTALEKIIGDLEYKYELSFSPEDIERIFSSQEITPTERTVISEASIAAENAESEDVIDEVLKAYNRVLDRIDTEVSDYFEETMQLPLNGMQVRSEYTLYGHFYFLKKILKNTEKVRFYLDQESGIRAAFMAALGDRVKDRTADAFYVKYLKDLIIDRKIEATKMTAARVRAYMIAHPDAEEKEAHLALIRDELQRVQEIGPWKDRWVLHPIAKRYEPEKAMCWLTDMGDYDIDHQAHLFYKASAFGIDRFFMQARRRLSMIERPIKSASNVGRTWYGYSPYNPAMIQKLLDIFRVYYNYCLPGKKDGKTPAMRLGLAKGKVRVEDIIYL